MEQLRSVNPGSAKSNIVEIINGCRVTMNFREQPNPDVKDIVLGILLDSFAERTRGGKLSEDSEEYRPRSCVASE